MRIFKLLSKNLFRTPVRTLLTLSSIAVSLFLVATLVSILIQLTNPPETPDSGLRLINVNSVRKGKDKRIYFGSENAVAKEENGYIYFFKD